MLPSLFEFHIHLSRIVVISEEYEQKKKLSQERNSLALSYFHNSNPYRNQYSYYLWIKLPDGRSHCIQELVEKNNIQVMESRLFSTGISSPDSHIRIALSTPKILNELEKGLRLLKQIID